jgi:hypothetical protein
MAYLGPSKFNGTEAAAMAGYAGDDRWPHIADGTGVVSMTIVEPA